MKLSSLDSFLRSYLSAAFWTSDFAEGSGDYEENGNAPELFARLAPEAMERATADCARFESENEALLSTAYEREYDASQAGHDFWLTRNRHGVGFWDRAVLERENDETESLGRLLTTAAHSFGEIDLYEGDDGKLYF